MRYDLTLKPETKLERAVARWLRSEARDRDGSITDAYRDLEYGGCSSGVVGDLVYTRDAVAFYRRHRADIDAILREYIRDGVLSGPGSLNGWDDEDPLGREDNNQNIMAWFGFEEAARALCQLAGYDG